MDTLNEAKNTQKTSILENLMYKNHDTNWLITERTVVISSLQALR